ncbi:hypothetical protein ABXY91_002349 [Vibrio fluvialis]
MKKIRIIIVMLSHIAFFSTLTLVLMATSNVGLELWKSGYIRQGDGWGEYLIHSVRTDLKSIFLFYIFPSLVLAKLSIQRGLVSIYKVALRIWLVLGMLVLVYIDMVTSSCYRGYNLSMNHTYIGCYIYPQDVFNAFWGNFKLEIFTITVWSLILIIFGWKISESITRNIGE